MASGFFLSNKKESFSLESILESEEKYNLCVWKFYQKHFGKLKIVWESIPLPPATTIPFHTDQQRYIKEHSMKNVTCNVVSEWVRKRYFPLNQAAWWRKTGQCIKTKLELLLKGPRLTMQNISKSSKMLFDKPNIPPLQPI